MAYNAFESTRNVEEFEKTDQPTDLEKNINA